MDNSYDLNHAMAYYALSIQSEWLKKDNGTEVKSTDQGSNDREKGNWEDE
mgnify:CR=1 FL=1